MTASRPSFVPASRRLAALLAVVAVALVAAACGDNSSSSGTGTVTVRDAWARTSAAGQTAGALYFVIDNPTSSADALTAVSVPSTVAARAELHETMTGSSSTMKMDMGGSATTVAPQMSMQPAGEIAVPAKGKVTLRPGGYHVMLLDLAGPLVKGTTFEATLTLRSGTRTVKVEVRDA
jgi:hypothetical protein